ncbi:adhesion G-protein coupled receptor D1-like [Narcine bancroftii]|uniref:adhesion G-protein coupled receptor D1-like n=1 Tax=Narcine bancroftii TaxID=1343680 RepID=UPI00383217A5
MSAPWPVRVLLLAALQVTWCGAAAATSGIAADSRAISPRVGSQESEMTGFRVLKSASHYWPLERVEGLNELCDVDGSETDIVEGVVNKDILLNGHAGATLLHFGSSKNSCISDPELCSEAGVTFSFFWKNRDKQSTVSMASGGKLLSNRFSIYASVNKGFVEFHAHKTLHSWKATISHQVSQASG